MYQHVVIGVSHGDDKIGGIADRSVDKTWATGSGGVTASAGSVDNDCGGNGVKGGRKGSKKVVGGGSRRG